MTNLIEQLIAFLRQYDGINGTHNLPNLGKYGEVRLLEEGDVVNWLVSDAFGLDQARSVEAEQAIEAAEADVSKASLKVLGSDLFTQITSAK